jgi:hypothetical protein
MQKLPWPHPWFSGLDLQSITHDARSQSGESGSFNALAHGLAKGERK